MDRRAGPHRGGDSAARNLYYTDLAGLEAEAKRLDGDLKGIFEGLGYRCEAKL